MVKNRIVLDNGACTIKAGFSSHESPQWNIPNCIAYTKTLHTLVADEIFKKMKDHSQLKFHRGFERGYLVDPGLQQKVWDRLFDSDLMGITDFRSQSLLVTEPPLNMTNIQDSYNELVFEKYGFMDYVRCPTSTLTMKAHNNINKSYPPGDICLLIDIGYSFTHLTPIFNGIPINSAVKRINVGGKFLTNYLKEVISYRTFNMMEETMLINDVKEKLCYVSMNFDKELEMSRFRKGSKNSLIKEYVLPDYKNIKRGFIKDDAIALSEGVCLTGDEQTMTMNSERIAIPEVIFRPSDAGIGQGGVSEAVVEAIETTHPHLHQHLYNNILITGGSSLFPNFKERLEREVRQLAPADYPVQVFQSQSPINSTWQGGAMIARDETLWNNMKVTKMEYEEHGHSICRKRFSVLDL